MSTFFRNKIRKLIEAVSALVILFAQCFNGETAKCT